MRTRVLVLLSLTTFMFAQGASADEETTSLKDVSGTHMKLEDAIKQKEYEQSQKITDMELNAQAGSLSRYSMQAFLGYAGGPVDNLTSTQEPNPLNKKTPAQTNISGSVGIRYRMSSNDTIYLSTGVEGYFQPNGQKNPDLENPAIEYDHAYKVGGIQMYSGVEALKSTMSYYTGQGETAGAEIKQFMKWNVPNSQFILGTELTATAWFYDRDYRFKGANKDSTQDSDSVFNVIPSVEYRILHNLNFNTSYSTGWTHYRGVDATNTYSGNPGTWWVGLGYGITREIYVKPYLSFYPQAVSWNQTSFNLSTTVSLF